MCFEEVYENYIAYIKMCYYEFNTTWDVLYYSYQDYLSLSDAQVFSLWKLWFALNIVIIWWQDIQALMEWYNVPCNVPEDIIHNGFTTQRNTGRITLIFCNWNSNNWHKIVHAKFFELDWTEPSGKLVSTTLVNSYAVAPCNCITVMVRSHRSIFSFV